MEFVASRKVFVYYVEKISSNFCGYVFAKRWIEPYYVSLSLFACPWIIIIIIIITIIIIVIAIILITVIITKFMITKFIRLKIVAQAAWNSEFRKK